MSDGYRFDETARAERFYVATLLAHLLMAHNFEGLRALFRHVFGDASSAGLDDDFEVVSELDPLRDGSLQHSDVKRLYRELKRVAVPDLFLRWSHLCLVIEAKFFTDPSEEGLNEQVRLQREAITKVQPYTRYKAWVMKHAILNLAGSPSGNVGDIIVITWDDMLRVMESVESKSDDISYCVRMIQAAQVRARHEIGPGPSITFEKLTFDTLLQQLPRLIGAGKIFIGFTGGIEALTRATEDELAKRSHYKVSDVRWSDNWLPLDQFLHRLFELRGHFDQYDDRDA